MVYQRPWDQYEVSLLIECYISVCENGFDLEVELEKLSARLQNMAICKGEVVDETYRNLNGMHWQYQFIKAAFADGNVGSRVPPKLFVEMVRLFQTDKVKFNVVLAEAHRLAGDERVKSMISTKDKFAEWISKAYGHKFSANLCIECMDQASDYAQGHHISKIAFWEIVDYREFNKIRVKLSGSRIFRFFNRNLYKNFEKIGKLYADFIKELAETQNQSAIEPMNIEARLPQQNRDSQDVQSEAIQNKQNDDAVAFVQPSKQGNKNKLNQYSTWLLQVRGASVVTARAYVSNIKIANQYALEHHLISENIWDLEDTELKESILAILSDESFSEFNAVQHNRFSAALKAYGSFCLGIDFPLVRKRRKTSNINPTRVNQNCCPEQLKTLLLNRFPYGLRIDSLIDMMRLKGFADNEGVELTNDDALLKEQLLDFGICSEGKLYFISEEVCVSISAWLDAIFAEGPTVLYYEKLSELHQEIFEKYNIISIELFKDLLGRRDDDIYVSKNFVSRGSERVSELSAVERELHRVWGAEVKHTYDELSEKLPYIPKEKVRFYLSYIDGFVWSSFETFVSIDKIVITEEEKASIIDYIQKQCDIIGYVSINDIPLGNILEENYEVSGVAIHDSIYRLILKDKFALTGKILTRCNASIDILTIAKAYCAYKDKCTFSELNDYVASVNGVPNRQVAFRAAYDQLVRVGEDLFVADRFVKFSVDEIDALIEEVISGDFTPIMGIATFILFPDCNYTWNHYLLESFCYKYSKKFRLEVLNFNDRNAGIIVKKEFDIGYYDILAMAASRSPIELTRSTVGNFLCESGYTSKRSMNALDSVVEKAKTLRETK